MKPSNVLRFDWWWKWTDDSVTWIHSSNWKLATPQRTFNGRTLKGSNVVNMLSPWSFAHSPKRSPRRGLFSSKNPGALRFWPSATHFPSKSQMGHVFPRKNGNGSKGCSSHSVTCVPLKKFPTTAVAEHWLGKFSKMSRDLLWMHHIPFFSCVVVAMSVNCSIVTTGVCQGAPLG
jgi:hypothetical protein